MNWKVRHEGSPRAIDNLTAEQVVEGLQDGLWEATDEVMGPEDSDWLPIETHPLFSEVAAELEPPPTNFHEDETRLDMNPLIDVCLVLLIFFILTTSYAALQKVLDMPGVSSKNASGPLKKSKEAVEKTTIKVVAHMEDGKAVFKVEEETVQPAELRNTLTRYVGKTHKTEILFDAKDVDWGTVVHVQDAAKGAGVERVNFLK